MDIPIPSFCDRLHYISAVSGKEARSEAASEVAGNRFWILGFGFANTVTIDGILGGEYGSANQPSTVTGQTRYITWDAANLYVDITNANLAAGAILYIDSILLVLLTGGTNAAGNLIRSP